MFRMKWIGILVLSFSLNVFAQNGVFDGYSHIIVPTKFIIQDKPNDFQLNSLVRMLFKDEGFEVYMDQELIPDEYSSNPCKGLRVDLEKRFNLINTFIIINILDCQNKIVFSSEGSSREKDFKTAYQEAIRMAFRGVESANFSINSKKSDVVEQETKYLSKDERIEMRKGVVREQSDVYHFKGEKLYFFPVDDEIHIYDENAYDILAKLTPISENLFIYNAEEIDGVMRKSATGDFELEYREPSSKETQIVHYKLTKKAD